MSEHEIEREQRTAPLELFFDLVFVFAFTQVTTVFSEQPTWPGLGRGLLILVALWWAWVSYAWLTNSVDTNRDGVLAAILVAMGAMFVAALAVPEAFGRHGVMFGVAFLIVAVMHPTLYVLSSRSDSALIAAVLRGAPSNVLGALLILAAGFLHGAAKPTLWIVALVVAFVAPLFGNLEGWHLSAAHFVERHGLIVIIAIGESLIGIGLGARGSDLGAKVVVAALLGLLVAMSFWLAYFDYFPLRLQHLLAERRGAARIVLARDAYSYLHLPMVAGVILFAFAMKVTLAHVTRELDAVPAFALCAGPALFLLGFVALRLRISRSVGRGRATAAVVLIALSPVATVVPALAAVALVAAVWVALHAYELIGWRDARAEVRSSVVSTP